MKALSIRQPYASLIMIGAKRCETRTWMPTPKERFNTPFVVCASKVYMPADRDLAMTPMFRAALEGAGLNPLVLPVGAALGIVTIDRIHGARALTPWLTETEIAFGHYEKGYYAWALKDIRPFPEPIPYKGRLGFFEYDGVIPTVEPA